MNTLNHLKELFQRFPGIGPRQAQRFVYFLLTTNAQFRSELASLLHDLQHSAASCSQCQRFHADNDSQGLCRICADTNRDQTMLMIVEKDIDMENVERSQNFLGHYFILGGTLPVLEKNPEQYIRLQALKDRLSNNVDEVIFALSATPEADNTVLFLRDELSSLASEHTFTMTTLGRGLSTGSELEYSDTETIKNALKNRQ